MTTPRAFAVFCDDIRQEASGKEILIGVYGSDIIPTSLPATILLSIWIKVEGVTVPVNTFTIELTNSSGRSLAKFDGTSTTSQPPLHGTFMAALGGLPITFEKPDILTAWIDINGQRLEAGGLVVSPPRQKPVD